MRVLDVLIESEDQQTDEGPLRGLKRTLFKNTKMGKKAQVDVELERDAKAFYKEFMSDVENFNDPRPTVANLADWMAGKDFKSDKAQIIKLLRMNPTFMNKLSDVSSKVASGLGKIGSGIKKTADLAVGAAKKVKSAVTPEPSKIDPRQGELDLNSMYNESVIINEISTKGMNIELSSGEVMNVLKAFMKQGREAMVRKGNPQGVQSKYADNKDAKDDKPTAKKSDNKGAEDLEVAKALELVKSRGYEVVKKPGLFN